MNKKAMALPTLGKFILLLLVVAVVYFVFIKGGIMDFGETIPQFEKTCSETGLVFDEHMQILYEAVQEKDYLTARIYIDYTKKCFPKQKIILDKATQEKILQEAKKS